VPRILVADDNTNIQKMVSLAFEERGIDVVSVGNGEAAVRRIPDLSPDLVLADVFMPVRNGYEVCEFVKKDGRFSHVPVILLVGAFDPLDEKEARRVGADGVLKKPFVPPDPLIAMVTSALEKNPKVAAEMAKAKEAKEAVVDLPPPSPAMEIPAKAEPKPLPEFPEPTPEEAAVIYGFGKGVRNLDSVEDQKDEPQTPKTPAAEDHEEEQEEFDGASTTHDWRRAAALNINIPDEPGGKLAFASDEDFNPVSFPSEQDVRPKRVHEPDGNEETEPTAEVVTPSDVHAEAAEPATEAAHEPAPEVAELHTVEPEPTPLATEETKPQTWTETIAPAPSEYPDEGWLTETHESVSEQLAVEEAAEAPATSSEHEGPPDVAPPVTAHAAFEEPFFADEPQAGGHWVTPPETTEGSTPEQSQISAPIEEPGLASEPSDEGVVVRKDPDLEESAAVHVNPEPFLVREEAPRISQYSGRSEDTAALHSYFSPASGEPVLEQAPETESIIYAPADTTIAESKPDEVDERFPTIAPPNREALADIPFLNPPPLGAPEPAPASPATPVTVDAVVEKLMERLEPQLHELLSEGVLKPLVQNLLQQEQPKKEK